MKKSKTKTGYIHSIESCGTVDGPGIRFVVFMQGCALACLYCHNPDSHARNTGEEISIEALIKQIEKYKHYMDFSGGGLTVSGGEPLLQVEFLEELFKTCREKKIHTALDTSGNISPEISAKVLEYTDLVLLDIKAFEEKRYKELTSGSLEMPVKMARYLASIKKPTWIRYVLVPGLTDHKQEISELADFVSELKNIERVEILPFHKMGEYKWEDLGKLYQLKETETPTPELVEEVKGIFQSRGLLVR